MNLNATLFAQIVVFFLLAWFTMKFVWPPIVRALDERAKRIADGLEAAERGKADLDRAMRHATESMREGKEKAADVLAQAEKRGLQIIEEAKAQAKVEADKVLAGSRAEIDQEAARAREELRGRVAELAIAGAEKILRREIDLKAHTEMLSLIAREL